MVPNAVERRPAVSPRKDDDGFVLDDLEAGIIVAGVARRPEDVASSVRDATGAAARAWSWPRKEGVMDKIGVFLCSGCGIGEALDIDALEAVADEERRRDHVTHECLCAPRAWLRSRSRRCRATARRRR